MRMFAENQAKKNLKKEKRKEKKLQKERKRKEKEKISNMPKKVKNLKVNLHVAAIVLQFIFQLSQHPARQAQTIQKNPNGDGKI